MVQAKWPEVGHIDEVLMKSSQYLMDAAHSFRIHLKTYTTVKKPKDLASIGKPEVGTVWVAKEFPLWQRIILTTMKELYVVSTKFGDRKEDFSFKLFFSLLQENGNKLPDNKAISAKLTTKEELKKYFKRAMPFVQTTREKIESVGISALNLTVEYDECEILKTHGDYLRDTLDVRITRNVFISRM